MRQVQIQVTEPDPREEIVNAVSIMLEDWWDMSEVQEWIRENEVTEEERKWILGKTMEKELRYLTVEFSDIY